LQARSLATALAIVTFCGLLLVQLRIAVYAGGDLETAPMEVSQLERNIKDETYTLGTVSDGVLYLTAAADTGGGNGIFR